MRVRSTIKMLAAGTVCGAALGRSFPTALADNVSDYNLLPYNYDFQSNGSIDLYGRLYVPDDYDPAQSYGIVMFLHGAGEGGTDNLIQADRHTDNLLAAAKSRDFFVYLPQSQDGSSSQSFWGDGSLQIAADVLGRAATQYHIDPGRMYVTGLSNGGRGTNSEITENPNLFAAFVPLSAASTLPAGDVSAAAVGRPIWYYHARNDGTVSVSNSRNSVNHIRSADGLPAINFGAYSNPGDPTHANDTPYYADGSTFYAHNNLRYSEYASGGHSDGTWERAYGETNLYDWMLSKSNPIGPLEHAQTVLFDLGRTASTTDGQGRHWNQATGYGNSLTHDVVMPFAVDSEGAHTAVSLAVVNGFGTGNDGPTGVTGYEDEVTEDYWSAGYFLGDGSRAGEFALHGLTPGEAYKVKLLAAITGKSGTEYYGRYVVNGQVIDFNSATNANNDWMTFDDVIADANGEVLIAVMKDPAHSSHYAVLNAVSITPAPEPASAVMVMMGVGGAVLSRKRRRVSG